METKISILRRNMAGGMWREAVLLAAKFQDLGAEKAAILKAREAILRPQFQRQIGRSPEVLIDDGIAALVRRYGDV